MGVKTEGYNLTVETNEFKGALSSLVSLVGKYTTIESLVTLDSGDRYLCRIMLTLPKEITHEDLEKIVHELDAKGFRVTHCEKLTA